MIKHYEKEDNNRNSDSVLSFIPEYDEYEAGKLLEKYVETHDPLIKNKLIEANLRAVKHVANELIKVNKKLDYNELISVGFENIGSIIDRYEPTKGSFRAFLFKNLNGYMLQSLGGSVIDNDMIMMSKLFNLNPSQVLQITSIRKFMEIYKKENGFYPSVEDIAHVFNYRLMNVKGAINILNGLDKIDNYDIGYEEKSELLFDNSIEKKLKRYVDTILTPRERQVIVLRFGLFGNEPISNSEITKLLNISNKRLYQILNNGLKKLRKRFEYFYDLFEEYNDRLYRDNISYVKRDECEGYAIYQVYCLHFKFRVERNGHLLDSQTQWTLCELDLGQNSFYLLLYFYMPSS